MKTPREIAHDSAFELLHSPRALGCELFMSGESHTRKCDVAADAARAGMIEALRWVIASISLDEKEWRKAMDKLAELERP